MAIEIIKTKEIDNKVYRIELLDDKFTVYVCDKAKDINSDEKDKFSAVASFEDIESAKKYIESQK